MPEASSLLKDEKFYKKLDLYLNNIHKDVIRLDEDRTKDCVRVTTGIVESLIKRLKNEDRVFAFFFQKLSYVGSYFDGLRVSDATEFDLNVVLNLQCNYDIIKIKNSDECPGHVLLNVKNVVIDEKKFDGAPAREWKRWVDADGYLLHDAVLRWWESILAKISERGRYPIGFDGKSYEVRSYKNGPALTFHISNEDDGLEIDVDLVPVLEFPFTRSPPFPTRWISSGLSKKFVDGTSWAVVPKPMDDKRLWRLSFTAQEQKIMSDLRHLKYINKMLKRFRDANRLNIPSYQIKTFFIWEAYEKRQACDEDFWKKPPSYLLAYMLVKLAEALEKKELKFFWNTHMNLFGLLLRRSEVLVLNMEGQVKRILTSLNKLIESGNLVELERKLYQLFGIAVQRDGTLINAPSQNNAAVAELNCPVPVQNCPAPVENDTQKEVESSYDDYDFLTHSTDSYFKPSTVQKKTEQNQCRKQATVLEDNTVEKYSAYLAEKLNQFNPRTRSILINKINNLIFEAEMDTITSATSTLAVSSFTSSSTSYDSKHLISFSSPRERNNMSGEDCLSLFFD